MGGVYNWAESRRAQARAGIEAELWYIEQSITSANRQVLCFCLSRESSMYSVWNRQYDAVETTSRRSWIHLQRLPPSRGVTRD